jgi:aminopeptidase N
LDLTAIVPDDVLLGSNGMLVDSVQVEDTIKYRWVSKYPIATYLMVISAQKDYNLDIIYWENQKGDLIPIRFYWNNGENAYRINHIKEITPKMMTYFSELFGDYPFEKNGYATLNDLFFYGGMEHQTLTSLCANCWNEDLIVHEFAHQYFGNSITCATWADIWLNESFATYCEALWYEHTKGKDDYKQAIENEVKKYFKGNPGFPIVNPDWAVITPDDGDLFNGAIIYSKGAVVLDMLRYVIGDSLFFNSMNSFAQHKNLKYGNATTINFITIVNKVVKKDLTWFFNQWLYHPDHPVYENSYSIQQTDEDWIVSFTAKQIKPGSTFFQMPIELKIKFDDDSYEIERIFNLNNNQMFEFRYNVEPTKLEFDPDNRIVLKKAKTKRID